MGKLKEGKVLIMECYVVQFENGYYWKGQGAKITKELRSAAFLRKCDIEGYNFSHIRTEARYKYNLLEPKVLRVRIEIVEEN